MIKVASLYFVANVSVCVELPNDFSENFKDWTEDQWKELKERAEERVLQYYDPQWEFNEKEKPIIE